MLARRSLAFAIFTIFFFSTKNFVRAGENANATAKVEKKSDGKDTLTTTTISTNTTNTTTPKTLTSTTLKPINSSTPVPILGLCDNCACSGSAVNCTNLGLENSFYGGKWPSKPLKDVVFTGNVLVHLKKFPNATIERLILSHCRITKIDDNAFANITNLTELDLSHNELTSELLKPAIFEGTFSETEFLPLARLRILNLGHNALHTLHQDIFEHVTDLRVLILSGNPLTTIDQGTTNALTELFYLENLDLSDCDLGSMPDHLLHVSSTHLKKLNLKGNRLSRPPTTLEDCQNLEYLSLDANPIEKLNARSGFPAMKSLKELSLGSLQRLVHVGEGAFSGLTALETVRLRNCPRLKEIDENAFVHKGDSKGKGAIWPPLKNLDLSDNALRYLPNGLVGRWDHLEKLDLSNNEWSCDCENQYLIGSLLPSMGKKLMGDSSLNELKCSMPPEHAGKNLTSLATRKLRCLDLYEARPERDAAVLVGVLIGLLLAIPIALTVFVFWRKGFFFCGAQGPASFSRAFYKRTANDDEI